METLEVREGKKSLKEVKNGDGINTGEMGL